MKADMALARRAKALRERTTPHLEAPAKPWYEFRNADVSAPGGVDLFIYDAISWLGITAADLVRDLMMLDTNLINVRINSPGGEVWDGIAIKNALQQHKATVNVTIDGVAASIASVIALAGETITMMPGARMMIHNATGFCEGTAEDMRETAELLEMINGDIAELYAARSGKQDAAFFAEAMNAGAMNLGTWYTAAECVELGLADKIGGAPEAKAQANGGVVGGMVTTTLAYRDVPEALKASLATTGSSVVYIEDAKAPGRTEWNLIHDDDNPCPVCDEIAADNPHYPKPSYDGYELPHPNCKGHWEAVRHVKLSTDAAPVAETVVDAESFGRQLREAVNA